MATIKVYCKHFISTEFRLTHEKVVTIHGTNKYLLDTPKDTPYCNEIDAGDWAEVERIYKESGNCPHLFGDERHPVLIFTAKNEKEAELIGSESPDVIPEKYVMTADDNLEQEAPKSNKRK